MAESVIDRTLLRVGKDAVRLRRCAEILLGFLLILRIAIRVPLERSLTIGRFDLVGGSIALDAEHLVIITLGLICHRRTADVPVLQFGPLLRASRGAASTETCVLMILRRLRISRFSTATRLVSRLRACADFRSGAVATRTIAGRSTRS